MGAFTQMVQQLLAQSGQQGQQPTQPSQGAMGAAASAATGQPPTQGPTPPQGPQSPIFRELLQRFMSGKTGQPTQGAMGAAAQSSGNSFWRPAATRAGVTTTPTYPGPFDSANQPPKKPGY